MEEDINRYFEILGLKPGASLDEVKEAYLDLVKVWHPDRFTHDPKLQQKAQEKLKEINEAFQKVQDFLINLHKYQQATGPNKNESDETKESAKTETKQTSETSKEEDKSYSQPPPFEQAGPSGVGGWLMLLIIGMMLVGPLMGAGNIGNEFMTVEREYPGIKTLAQWNTYKSVTWGVFLAFAALGFYGGLGLARGKDWSVVRRAKIIWWTCNPILIILMGLIIPRVVFGEDFVDPIKLIGGLIASLIAAGIWTAYLSKSKRVRNTYGGTITNDRETWFSKHSRGLSALLISIPIIGIIAAIVIPYYVGLQERDRKARNEQAPPSAPTTAPASTMVFDGYVINDPLQKPASAPSPAPYGYDMVPGKGWVPSQAPDTTTPKQPSSNLTELYNNRGNDHYSNGQYSLAIENYSKAIAINPNDSTLLLNRGNAYLRGGQRNNAILDFKKACKMGYEPSCNTLKSVLEIRQQETSGQVAVSTPLKPVALPPAQSPIKLIVKDEVSGLIWLWNANLLGKPMDWESANYFVQQLNEKGYAGYNDWRLPTADELKALSKNIQRYRLDFQNVQKNYWSATSSIGHKDTLANVDIGDGYVWYASIVNKTYVWPVRGSQKTVQN